jgi:two-component system nitrogen regulation response regulator NtrX
MSRTDDILVVDDEVNIVGLVVDLLHDEGYTVRSALNGAEALQLIAEHRPALILMDMYMPQMTGMMLLEHLQSQGIADIPVILMTASPRAAEQFGTNANVDYLAKPFDIEELLLSVSRYVLPSNPSTIT